MPRDPSLEHISAEEQFRRLMETSEEDLPPVPEPVGEARPVSGQPGVAPSGQAQTASAEGEKPEGRMGDPIERLIVLTEQVVANQQEFMVEFRVLQDIIEEALGGG